MKDKDILLAQINEKIIDFLHDRGFSCEVIENHGIVASFGNSTLLLSPRTDGCFATKATTLSKDEVLTMYRIDTKDSLLESDRQIGWWAYKNEDLPDSNLLHIGNHDHSIYEIQSAVDDMLKGNMSRMVHVTSQDAADKLLSLCSKSLFAIDAVVGENGQVQKNISTHEKQAEEINQSRKFSGHTL